MENEYVVLNKELTTEGRSFKKGHKFKVYASNLEHPEFEGVFTDNGNWICDVGSPIYDEYFSEINGNYTEIAEIIDKETLILKIKDYEKEVRKTDLSNGIVDVTYHNGIYRAIEEILKIIKTN